jgi:type IV pilus assembly protein PilB
MELSTSKLHDILVEPDYISELDFKSAVSDSGRLKVPLIEVLINSDLIQEAQLGRLIAEYFSFRFVDLRREKIDENIFILIPEVVARAKGVLVYGRDKEGFRVAMKSPDDIEFRNLLEKKLGDKVIPYFVMADDFEAALFRYKSGLPSEFQRILKLIKDKKIKREDRDQLIVNVVDTLLLYGYQNNASDVHIEPYANKIVVRFRIDGVMHDVLEAPKELMDFIIARVKILSKIRTDEHQAAQDGKFRYNTGNEVFDVRVSVLPVSGGENIVLRLLSSRNRQFSLTDLGLSDKDLKKVKKMVNYPHGMILATGPTGSGKTTSLYAILKILNKREVHIATIEDPVEYNIEGISQIQVNSKTNLSFAKGLRSILRQDPDVIMVGEIRDEETADIAINSALTGHLVLSTLHTNDAVTTLPRLMDMKIQPFLIASTVNVILAQRLVRKICENCRTSYTLTAEDLELIEGDKRILEIFKKSGHANLKKTTLYKGAGCTVCNNTGYIGRLGIFEVLEVTEKIKELINRQASIEEIFQAARAEGMATMMEDGFDKVFQGLITLEEVIHSVKE